MIMKCLINGNTVNLSKQNFLASGGEGSVYVLKGVAYKIYNDPNKMIPEDKIKDLSVLSSPYVIKPMEVIRAQNRDPIGYTMKYVKDTYALCQMFTKAFKTRNSISGERVLKLVLKLREGVQHVHNSQITIVDLNEMNFLLDKRFSNIYFIDVDSYQTKRFPATALMESVKDHHMQHFCEESDWFSWGIVTFQMFMGIHPYKGKHSKIKGLVDRMKGNISVFNKSVSIPKMCPPMDTIPEVFLRWYEAVFERGKRVPPPLDAQVSVALAPVIKVKSGKKVKVSLYLTHDQDIKDFQYLGGREVIVSDTSVTMLGHTHYTVSRPHMAVTRSKGNVVAVWLEGCDIKAYDMTARKDIGLSLQADAIASFEGQVYCKTSDRLSELVFVEACKNTIVTLTSLSSVMKHATILFDGGVLESLAGAWHCVPFNGLPFHVKELKDHRVFEAKRSRDVIMISSERKGRYYKHILFVRGSGVSYDCRKLYDVPDTDLNFVRLPTGLCVRINEDERLEMFTSIKVLVVDDDSVSSDMRLVLKDATVMAYTGNKLYKMTTK